MMEIRNTQLADIPALLAIYDSARGFMRRQGNMNQWTMGYPGPDIIEEDIQRGVNYVCLIYGKIAGVFSLIGGEDPTYVHIDNGQWLNNKPYWTIHRLASGSRQYGVGAYCLDWSVQKYGNIKIDTHRDNKPMQALLNKTGFIYCGIIHLPDGSERLAYQKEAPL